MKLGLHWGTEEIAVAIFDRGAIRAELTVPAAGREDGAWAERALDAAARHPAVAARDHLVQSITCEVSDRLTPDRALPVTLIRVTPRAPLRGHDPYPLPWGAGAAAEHRITHLAGGHNADGQEIVPLELAPIDHLAPPGNAPRFVVSAVGALLNPEHELRVGAALLARFPGANIEYSHAFHHSSFAVRERTAVVNLSLRERAEATATALSVAASDVFPGARLLGATNSGGSIPLARLAVTPVDAVSSKTATEAVGAAAALHRSEGTLRYATARGEVACELAGGLPSVVPTLTTSAAGKLATPASNIRAVATTGQAAADAAPTPAAASLPAVGAARLPRVDWLLTLTQVANEADMHRAKHAAESRVIARLVSTGVPPENVRTVESLVTATSYGNPGVIALRIRAIADAEMPTRLSRGTA